VLYEGFANSAAQLIIGFSDMVTYCVTPVRATFLVA
jgi:hypothetical protein